MKSSIGIQLEECIAMLDEELTSNDLSLNSRYPICCEWTAVTTDVT